MKVKYLFRINAFRFWLIMLITLLAKAATAASQYMEKPTFNYLNKGELDKTILFFVLSAVLALVGMLLSTFSIVSYNRQIQECFHFLRNKITQNFFNKNNQSVSEMENILSNNFDMLDKNYAQPIYEIIYNTFALLFSIGIILTVNWTFLVIIAVLTIINLLLPKIFEKKLSEANEKISFQNNKLLKTIDHWLGGLAELQRYGVFGYLANKMSQADQELEDSNVYETKIESISYFISGIGNGAAQIIISVWSGILFFQNKISLGSAMMISSFAFTIFNTVWVYAQAITQFKGIKKVNEQMLNLEQEVAVDKNKSDNDWQELQISNLKMKYPDGEEILYPDMKIKQGEKVLLSGDSGTGKSTLFKLILGQLKPIGGEIKFINQAGQKIQPDLEKIGYLAQDAKLFPASIADNITMFNQKLSNKLEKVIEKVQFNQDIASFTNGIETQVDLDADNLSGGQKQKVILARSTIHNSNFILMDEATSAIDSVATEKILQNILNSDATVIMIAHNFNNKMRSMFDREIHLKGREEE
ncbi:ABC-type bacteriocin/lantibiotic exporter with double-glycine peptidase domain [Lactobacillus colini]|uniref:ABC-type bacteriocin/lantibiotic exporter with double-glycine peptidase domain n=1 Tax=Lactobacillus colini TaxID=1819254 RepID=A0ABS4MD06_9LACO|nr:ABC transporter ATP-binding protein [Lactobacillus colini]MBP2057565.1 ABC-type bacteriocin/lantibiotic exporter with double-glycine peptidase domain [Lactobacillus colini]